MVSSAMVGGLIKMSRSTSAEFNRLREIYPFPQLLPIPSFNDPALRNRRRARGGMQAASTPRCNNLRAIMVLARGKMPKWDGLRARR